MFIKNSLLFSVVFFSITVSANSPTVFTPDFSANPVPIPAGTNLIPLCSNPMDTINCFAQWSQQAIPLAVNTHPNILPNMQLFVPTFMPSNVSPVFFTKNSIDNTNWKTYDFPSVSSSKKRSRSSRRSLRKDRVKRKKTKKVKALREEITVDSGKENNSKSSNQKPVTSETKALNSGVEKTATDTDRDRKAPNSGVEKTATDTDRDRKAPNSGVEKTATDTDRDRKALDSGVEKTATNTDRDRKALDSGVEKTATNTEAVSKPKTITQILQVSTTDPPAKFRLLEEDENGNIKVSEGQTGYIPADDMEVIKISTASFSPKPSALPVKENVPPPPMPSKPQKKLLGAGVSAQAKKSTSFFPAAIKEVQSGCFVIDREKTKTEAGFCFDCNLALSNQGKNVVEQIIKVLGERLSIIDKKSLDKQVVKLGEGGVNTVKICSPEVSLKEIIKNFEKTCPSPYRDFKKFAQKTYCESCKRGVAPEIMLAMMSIESAGKCAAVGTLNEKSREQSVGLFQVDSSQHQCLDNKKRGDANLQCLKNPINNLNTSIDILIKHYSEVNVEPFKQNKCKDWLKMNPTERDSWRRAVAAYNGGPGWISRVFYAAENIDKTLKNTDYLNFTHTFKTTRQCKTVEMCIKKRSDSICDKIRKHYENTPLRQISKNCWGMIDFLKRKENNSSIWKMDWEELRAYYFLEKLSPGNKRGTGRQTRWNESNLAHTEAVLGREAGNKSISRGMAELWREYITKNKFKDSCPNLK